MGGGGNMRWGAKASSVVAHYRSETRWSGNYFAKSTQKPQSQYAAIWPLDSYCIPMKLSHLQSLTYCLCSYGPVKWVTLSAITLKVQLQQWPNLILAMTATRTGFPLRMAIICLRITSLGGTSCPTISCIGNLRDCPYELQIHNSCGAMAACKPLDCSQSA